MRALFITGLVGATSAVQKLHVNKRSSCGCRFQDDLASFAQCVETSWLSGACPQAGFGVNVQYTDASAEAGTASLLLPHYPLPRGMKLAQLLIPVKGHIENCRVKSVELGQHGEEGFAPIVKYEGTEFFVSPGSVGTNVTEQASHIATDAAALKSETVAQLISSIASDHTATQTVATEVTSASIGSTSTETTTVETTASTTEPDTTGTTTFQRSTDATEAEDTTTGLITDLTSEQISITASCTEDLTGSACGDGRTSSESLATLMQSVSEPTSSINDTKTHTSTTSSEEMDATDAWWTYTYKVHPIVPALPATIVADADTPLVTSTGTELHTSAEQLNEAVGHLLVRPQRSDIDLANFSLIRIVLDGDRCDVVSTPNPSLAAIYRPQRTQPISSRIISF